MRRIVDDVCAAWPDQVLVNGDLAFAKGESEDYAAFRDLISPLRDRGTLLHLTLGNHDHRSRLIQSLAPSVSDTVTAKAVFSKFLGGVQWLFLDSLDDVNAVRGSLGAEQRAWLAKRLDGGVGPAVVCVHHNPERSLVGLRDAEEFLRIALPRRRVKAVLFGHTHRFRVWETDGLHFVNLPAVGFRFLNPDVLLGWVWARIDQHGMRLEPRGIDPRERDHGAVRVLTWRGE